MLGEVATPRIDITQLPPEAVALIARLQQQIQAQAREIAWRDAKLEKVNFELARLKRWKFGAKTEAMTAQQRALFQDTMAEDEASLRARLAALQADLPQAPKTPKAPLRKPRRQKLPEHLERVEHRHEPEDTSCPNAECGRPMKRIGEDVSEKLDIIPASGLVAHTMISRFVDHLPYYRQEPINARSGVHTPRSTLATWGGAGGAKLEPLFELQRRFILSCRVLHADETPVPLLEPGAGKTRKAYVWAWARSHHDPYPGVIYEFCLGRGAQYPLAFLGGKGPPSPELGWSGTLITDQYAGYNAVLDAKVYPQRRSALCADLSCRRRLRRDGSRRSTTGQAAAEQAAVG